MSKMIELCEKIFNSLSNSSSLMIRKKEVDKEKASMVLTKDAFRFFQTYNALQQLSAQYADACAYC